MKALEGELTLYRGAQTRRGFALRAAKQVEVFRQAGMGPEEVRACAGEERGSLARKLEDVAAILAAYEKELAGRFEDGEGELTLAAEKAGGAAFLRGARVWFYGFDMMPPTLHGLIAAVAEMGEDPRCSCRWNARRLARDEDIFRPLRASAARLVEKARERNVRVVWAEAGAGEEPPAELRFLSTELFSAPARGWTEAPKRVQLFEARSPREEARFAAALTRRLARTRNWRYRDVRLLVPSLDAYREPLREAFAECDIPLFLAESRPCARRPLCECLLTALQMLSRGARDEDLHACLASGCLDVSRRDAARLRNYAVAYGLRASAFFRPLKRGPAELVEALEPVRAAAMAPLLSLRERLRAAKDLRGQLEAVFGFLTDIRAYDKSLARQQALCAQDMYEAAGEEAQVWNRVVGALDQMAALLGEKKLPVREIAGAPRRGAGRGRGQAPAAIGRRGARPGRGQIEHAPGEGRTAAGTGGARRRRGGDAAHRAPAGGRFPEREALRGPDGRGSGAHAAVLRQGGAGDGHGLRLRHLPAGGRGRRGGTPRGAGGAASARLPPPARRAAWRETKAPRRCCSRPLCGPTARVAAALSGEMTAAERAALLSLAHLDGAREQLDGLRGRLPCAARRTGCGRRRRAPSRRTAHGQRFAAGIVRRLPVCPLFALRSQAGDRRALRAHSPRRGRILPRGGARLSGRGDGGGRFRPRARRRAHGARGRSAAFAPARRPAGPERAHARRGKAAQGRGPHGGAAAGRTARRHGLSPVGLEVRFGPEDGDACLRVGDGRDCALYGSIDRVDLWKGESSYVRVLDYKRGSSPSASRRPTRACNCNC